MKGIKYIVWIGLVMTAQSCFVAKKYNRPGDVVKEKYFRTDVLQNDSSTIADISWKQLFTDKQLNQYIGKGLDNNLDIRIALRNIDAAQAYVRQGRAAYFPSVNLGPGYTFSSPSLNSINGQILSERSNINQFDLTAGLSWEADIWGKIRSNERAANATYLQSVAAHQAVKSRLVAAIATTYYQLLALDQQKKVTESTIQNREQSVETIHALKSSGRVTEVAVQQTEAQLYNTRSVIVDIDNSIRLLENAFCILLGENPHPVDRSTLEEQHIDTPLNAGVPAELLANRPDVLSAEYGLINAFELTNIARSNFYPSLRITASGGIQSIDIDKLFSAGSLFGAIAGSLTQPIFNGRQIRTQYEVSIARQEEALIKYKMSVLNASREVSDALYTYKAADEKVKIKQKEFQAYVRAISDSEELMNYGMATYLEVLTSRQSLLSAQLSQTANHFTEIQSLINLYRALGGGQE